MTPQVTLDSALADILAFKVETANGTVLYDGTARQLSCATQLPKNADHRSELYYKVTATLVGMTESYCDLKTVLDFVWTIDGTNVSVKVADNNFRSYKKPIAAPVIELTQKNPGDNVPFNATNMLPGYTQSNFYYVTASYESNVTLKFSVKITSQDKKLAEVLKIKIEVVDGNNVKSLYDGLIKDMSFDEKLETTTAVKTGRYYKITVSLGKEVGNEYAGKTLTADFIWEIK